MTESDFERLFWEEFDGPGSPQRRQRIEELASERPEARRQLAELRDLARQLDEAEELPPPAALKVEIRRQLASRPAYGEGSGTGLVGWMRQTLAASWQTRLAYATLGALIGVFGAYLIAQGPAPLSEAERSQLSGAMNVGATDRLEPYELDLAGGAGTVGLLIDGTRLAVAVQPSPRQILTLDLSSDGGGLRPLRVEQIGASRHEISVGPGRVRLSADGPISMVLGLGPEPPATVGLRVSTSAGETVLDQRLDLTELVDGD